MAFAATADGKKVYVTNRKEKNCRLIIQLPKNYLKFCQVGGGWAFIRLTVAGKIL